MSPRTTAAKSPRHRREETCTAGSAGPRGIALGSTGVRDRFRGSAVDGRGVEPIAGGRPGDHPRDVAGIGTERDVPAGGVDRRRQTPVRIRPGRCPGPLQLTQARPAAGAMASARGSTIDLAPGQERHLRHEAWHVVQQRQGRVGPTARINGEPINDDPSLEREADVMGARAAGLMALPLRLPSREERALPAIAPPPGRDPGKMVSYVDKPGFSRCERNCRDQPARQGRGFVPRFLARRGEVRATCA